MVQSFTHTAKFKNADDILASIVELIRQIKKTCYEVVSIFSSAQAIWFWYHPALYIALI